MNERGWIEPIVERVVGQVLENHIAQLRLEIVRRVTEEIAAAPQPESAAVNDSPRLTSPAELARAVAEIQLGTSQREILRALLDTSSRYASRVALFVVKGSRATGWQARGFANSDSLKDFVLDEGAAGVVRAIRDRVLTRAIAEDFDPRFLEQVGKPASREVQILPLLLKDKVAALIYADSGVDPHGLLETGSLELLVLSTSAWLEVSSLRKQPLKDSVANQDAGLHGSDGAQVSSPSSSSAPPSKDPFASHTPAFSSGRSAMAAAASAGTTPDVTAKQHGSGTAPTAWGVMAEVQESASASSHAGAEMSAAVAERAPIDQSPAAPGQVNSPPEVLSAASLSADDQDIHRKAQRFARLLVDEIKLYNQAKVSEGRANRDLYARLKEVIEKSRITYQKRYGTTVAVSGNYFQHEIIRSLAEDDPSIMGASFVGR